MTTVVGLLIVGSGVCFVIFVVLLAIGLCQAAARGDEWEPRCTQEDEARLALYPEERR